MNQQLWAFWRYDQYPYCLCGKITSFSKIMTGAVHVEGYGNYLFSPFLICSEEQGKELAFELENLQSRYRDEMEVLKKNFDNSLTELWQSHKINGIP